MLFNSFIFWAFFALVFSLYWKASHRWQNLLLLAASYVFYGYWDWRFLFLLAASTTVDFFAGLGLGRAKRPGIRRLYLTLSVLTNLGALGFFKYYDFFATEFARLLQSIGFQADVRLLGIILPVGISFYTFQSLSYTIDVYRRKVQPIHQLTDFALYVSFFPQLVAGPIERASRLLPQVQSIRRFDVRAASEGLILISCGLFKKLIVADNLAAIVNRAYSLPPADVSAPEILVGTYAFAFQIYADFSGYSDIARGLAKLLGFELMVNFKHPYVATNPAEFWHRWHISLSTWLRDYLYIPLGGSRSGPLMTYRNLLLTMLLGGLWHGAAWNFVLWGAFHGLLLSIHRLWDRRTSGDGRTPHPNALIRGLKIIGMFHVTCYGWLLFRAQSLDQVVDMTRQLFVNWDALPVVTPLLMLTVLFALPVIIGHMFEVRSEKLDRLLSKRLWPLPLFHTAVIVTLIIFGSQFSHVFIYFQF
jgi:D-alanyl-lipoteichoic acid acyltransferase DltB (MBOAT superfamily)